MSRRSRRHGRIKGRGLPPQKSSKTSSLYKNRSVPKKKITSQSKKRPKKLKKIKPDVKQRSMKLAEVPEQTPVMPDPKDIPQPDEDAGDSQKDNESFKSPHTEVPSESTEDDKDPVSDTPPQVTEEVSASTVSRSENCDEENNTQPGEGSCDKTTDIDSSAQSIPSCCHICKKEMDSSASLSLHLKRQHNINNPEHRCLVCNKLLSSASSLDRHMLVHSGERPFKCKLCDMAFTTNGNMHRHMRTHGELAEPSDAAKVGETKKKDLKRKLPSDDVPPVVSSPRKPDDGPPAWEGDEKLHCPVCGKSFLCKYGLQSHMETHPNDPILCQECGEISGNYSVHINHSCNVQGTKQPPDGEQPVSHGFQDITFMDFSAQKFSLVSKHFCENNIKRPSSAFHVFECSKCDKAFPCGRALNLHKNVHNGKIGTFCPSCHCDFENSNFLQSHQLKHRCPEHCFSKNNSRDDVITQLKLMAHGQQPHAGKEDFLALLQLQTKQTQLSFLRGLESCQITEENFENMDYFVYGKLKSGANKSDVEGGNDFADIQSIISLTSKAPLISAVQSSSTALCPTSPLPASPLLKPQSPQVAESANASPEIPSKTEILIAGKAEDNESMTVSNCIYSCKVCIQKFKSITALKHHNRLHVQRGSSYSCHLCSYVSVDKSTLIRHLRTHNGERPFQCVICKYAFTTKANCERHVRKRHKKLTKAEIRNSMQYNPNMSLKVVDIASSDIGNSETVCKYCNVDFKFNRVLRHHLRSLHNSCNRKPFTCKICKFGFSTKNNCIRHVLKQHPDMKDKLKSVVIPNSQLENINSRIQCNVDNKSCDYGKSDVQSGISVLKSIPVDLSNKPGSTESRSETFREKSPSADVIAAESLVSLSEAIPMQSKPLDLTAKPLDLSYKSLIPVAPRYDSRPASIYSILSYSSAHQDGNFLDLTTSEKSEQALSAAFPNQSIVHANFSENPSPKFGDSAEHSVQKLRAFTCLYCSAGFTLKSNMERHVKRKHPEYARPTRSRNFIPTVVVTGPQKQNMATLSNKTRDALRNVLNNKVQSLPTQQQTQNVIQSMKNNDLSYPASQIRILPSDFRSKSCENEISKYVHTLDLSLSSQKYNDSMSQISPKCGAEQNMDDNSLDLASVSAVICTANSEQLKKYFEKSPLIDKGSGHDSENSEVKEANEIDDVNTSGSCVSCPFCARKFPWTSSLRRHILTHTGQKPYKCPLCSLWFTTKSNCERHLVSKHGQRGDLITRTVPERPFKCNQCPTSTFSTQGNLRKHFYLKHWTKSCMGMNSKPVNSENSCDNEMLDKTIDCSDPNLVQSPKNISSADKGFSHISSEENALSGIIHCHFCIESFTSISDLANHMHKHNNVIYMCYLCRKTFPKHDACLNHFKTSHSLVYSQIAQCEVNSRLSIITQNAEFCNDDNDRESDASISAMACVVCFQKISSVDDLQQHVKNHVQKERPCNDAETHSISPLSDNARETEDVSRENKTSHLGKRSNSLLFFFSSEDDRSSHDAKQNEHFGNMKVNKVNKQDEGSDLIQNLLGIHDSKMLDEMLNSADSAARLLGVKEV